MRGGGKLALWRRALDLAQAPGGPVGRGGRRLSTLVDVTEDGSISSGKVAGGEGAFRADVGDAAGKSAAGDGADGASSSNAPTPPGPASQFPNESRMLQNPPASQFPDEPQVRLKNDRYFRSRNNSSVANMLKLLEAAPSETEVASILSNHLSDPAVSSRWPWLPLLDALQRGPKPYLALEVFNWKKDNFDGGDPREYAKMISTAGRLNQLDIATTLFRQMEEKGLKRLPITCNALMSAYSKNDRAEDAVAIFEEMMQAEECKPTLVTYNTLISMYSKLNVSEMEKYYQMCISSGFHPDKVTFNSVIWGYMRGRELEKMEKTYDQLKKTGCRPDAITFSGLIIGFAKANNLEKMEKAFNHMQEEGYPITTTIAEILTEIYAISKKFDKMERIMKIANNTPGASCSSRMYGFAVHSYAESGRVLDMEETMDRMFTAKRLFTSARTLEAVIAAYGDRINFEGLAMVLDRIRSMGWVYHLSTYHALLSEYGKRRELGRMEEVFKEMEGARDVEPTEETYNILAESYRAAGDDESVKKVIDKMNAAGFKTEGLANVEIDRVWTDEEIYGGKAR